MNSLKSPKILICLFIILSFGCSYTPRTCQMLYQAARKKQYDVIVIPGVPLENGKWSRTMKARVYWSKHLYDAGIAKNIMYSGNAVYTPYVESEVMAKYAEAIGIPREHIFTESKAEHSTENIYYSYKKAKQLGFKKVALASDPFQTKMLYTFTRRHVSKDVDMIPIVFDTLIVMELMLKDPDIDFKDSQVANFTPLPERKGFFSRLVGTIGWDRDKKAYE